MFFNGILVIFYRFISGLVISCDSLVCAHGFLVGFHGIIFVVSGPMDYL